MFLARLNDRVTGGQRPRATRITHHEETFLISPSAPPTGPLSDTYAGMFSPRILDFTVNEEISKSPKIPEAAGLSCLLRHLDYLFSVVMKA